MFSSIIKITYIALLWTLAGPFRRCFVHAVSYDVVTFLTGIKPYEGDPVQIEIPSDAVENLKNILERNPKFLDDLLLLSKKPSVVTELIVDKKSLQYTEEKDVPKLASLTAYHPADTPTTENTPKTISINGKHFVLISRAKALWKHGFNLIKNLTSPLKNLNHKLIANGTTIPQDELKSAVNELLDKKNKSEEEENVRKNKEKGGKGRGKWNLHVHDEEEDEDEENDEGEGKWRGKRLEKEDDEHEDLEGKGDIYEDIKKEEEDEEEEDNEDVDKKYLNISKTSRNNQLNNKSDKKKIENMIRGYDNENEKSYLKLIQHKAIRKSKKSFEVLNDYDVDEDKHKFSRPREFLNKHKSDEIVNSDEEVSKSDREYESENFNMNNGINHEKHMNFKKIVNGDVKKRGKGIVNDYDESKKKSRKGSVKNNGEGNYKIIAITEKTNGSDSDDESESSSTIIRGKKGKDIKKTRTVNPSKPENVYIDKLVNGKYRLTRRGNYMILTIRKK